MAIDIAFSINQSLALPMLATANSILRNTAQPEEIRFNIVIPPETSALFRNAIDTAFPERGQQFRIQEYLPPSYLRDYLDAKFKAKDPVRKNSRYMQYSRLFLKSAFPDLTRVIYLDADVIVLRDIKQLFAQGENLTAAQFVAAVPQFFPAIFYFSSPIIAWKEIQQFQKTFNSGVLLTDLSFWTEAVYDRLKYYLEFDAQHNYQLYHLGDETVINLMFKQDYLPLDASWNRCGYGNARLVTWFLNRNLEQINIIHWSGGHHKPWRSKNIVFGEIWHQYRPASLPDA